MQSDLEKQEGENLVKEVKKDCKRKGEKWEERDMSRRRKVKVEGGREGGREGEGDYSRLQMYNKEKGNKKQIISEWVIIR